MLTAARIGPYEVIERIGIGGMAEVFKASLSGEEGFERLVAVKRILPNIAEDTDFVAMFIDEAKIAVQLSHPNIAQIYDLGRDEDTYYIAQEYIHGRDMEAIIKRQRDAGAPLPVPFVLHVATKVCEALSHAHEATGPGGRPLNLIHRDISPSNILVSFEGAVKVIDFGLAKAAGRAVTTQAGMVKGKLAYLSSEQARGLEIDSRSDLFSLGTCMWEWLTGERLFRRANDVDTVVAVQKAQVPLIRARRPEVPPALEAIVMKALRPDPVDRVQSASEMHELLLSCAYEHRLLLRRNAFAEYVRALFPEDRDPTPPPQRRDTVPSAPIELAPRPGGGDPVLLDRPKRGPRGTTAPPPRGARTTTPSRDRPTKQPQRRPPPGGLSPSATPSAGSSDGSPSMSPGRFASAGVSHHPQAPGPDDIRAFAEQAGFEVEDQPQLHASVIGLDLDSSDDNVLDVRDDEVDLYDDATSEGREDLYPSFSQADADDDESWPTAQTRQGDASDLDDLTFDPRRPRMLETAPGRRGADSFTPHSTRPAKQTAGRPPKQTEGAPLQGRFRGGRPIVDGPGSDVLSTDLPAEERFSPPFGSPRIEPARSLDSAPTGEELLPPTPSVVERDLRPRTGEIDFDDETFAMRDSPDLMQKLLDLRSAHEEAAAPSPPAPEPPTDRQAVDAPSALVSKPVRHLYEPEDYAPRLATDAPTDALREETGKLMGAAPALLPPSPPAAAPVPDPVPAPRFGTGSVPSVRGIDADDLFSDLTNPGKAGSEALDFVAADDEETGSQRLDTLPPSAESADPRETDSISRAIDEALERLEHAADISAAGGDAFLDVPTAALDEGASGETSDDLARSIGHDFDIDEATSIEPSLRDLEKVLKDT